MSTPFSILTHLNRRHVLGALGLATVAAVGAPLPALAQTSVNLAMIGEPQSLDPMASTADLVSIIMQHVYEPLYTFDDKWVVKPMLASDMPKISADGKTYTIEIRKGVKLRQCGVRLLRILARRQKRLKPNQTSVVQPACQAGEVLHREAHHVDVFQTGLTVHGKVNLILPKEPRSLLPQKD